jgi:hypothetical protein
MAEVISIHWKGADGSQKAAKPTKAWQWANVYARIKQPRMVEQYHAGSIFLRQDGEEEVVIDIADVARQLSEMQEEVARLERKLIDLR